MAFWLNSVAVSRDAIASKREGEVSVYVREAGQEPLVDAFHLDQKRVGVMHEPRRVVDDDRPLCVEVLIGGTRIGVALALSSLPVRFSRREPPEAADPGDVRAIVLVDP